MRTSVSSEAPFGMMATLEESIYSNFPDFYDTAAYNLHIIVILAKHTFKLPYALFSRQ